MIYNMWLTRRRQFQIKLRYVAMLIFFTKLIELLSNFHLGLKSSISAYKVARRACVYDAGVGKEYTYLRHSRATPDIIYAANYTYITKLT